MTPCCKAILIPCPECKSDAGQRCTKPGGYGGLMYRGQCHVARSNAYVKVCALLEAPCKAIERIGKSYRAEYDFGAVKYAIKWCMWREQRGASHTVALLDGTIIREWSAIEACDVCKQPIKDYGCDCMPF